ncbi:MAG: hypothetical protein K2N36_08255 [Ruminiclostridium sp.]|nr:hypothetical protein [Ruminiclostridium sp.]
MTQYICDCCGRIAPASDWNYIKDDGLDEIFVVCPHCDSEVSEYEEEDKEEEHEEDEEEEDYA